MNIISIYLKVLVPAFHYKKIIGVSISVLTRILKGLKQLKSQG